ncbi:MAG: deoxyribonuclease IV [Acidobacteriaceae bacterium]
MSKEETEKAVGRKADSANARVGKRSANGGHLETDVLKLLPQEPASTPSAKRKIGIHTSTSGGVHTAAERAWRLGCNTFQVFSSSPRMWKPFQLSRQQCEEMMRMRDTYGIEPVAIHVSYLVNLASQTDEFYEKSIAAFRGEVERGLALGAEYLVLHPGSYRGLTREQGLDRAAAGIERAVQGLDLGSSCNFRILIENTAGAEFSLGGSFEQVAELLERLRPHAPMGACIDTCHSHVAGYDIVSEEGYEQTMRHLGETVGTENVRVWHCNDAKAERGSKLDRHEHIGRGSIGIGMFRRLLNDPRFKRAAFIAETPVDEPLDDLMNVNVLKDCSHS